MLNSKRNNYNLVKAAILFVFSVSFFYVGFAYADATTISGIAGNVHAVFKTMVKLITGGSVLAGFGFALAAILKFKAHKDNPTQIPVGTPIALLFIAVALMFLPVLFGAAGQSLFETSSASLSGVDTLG